MGAQVRCVARAHRAQEAAQRTAHLRDGANGKREHRRLIIREEAEVGGRQDEVARFDRAISTSGGVRFDQLDDMLRYSGRDNTYLGGEMLDWDAPTGGYLLQACFSMGYRIGTALAQQIPEA